MLNYVSYHTYNSNDKLEPTWCVSTINLQLEAISPSGSWLDSPTCVLNFVLYLCMGIPFPIFCQMYMNYT
jgi:hypothetical protein